MHAPAAFETRVVQKLKKPAPSGTEEQQPPARVKTHAGGLKNGN